MSTRNILFRQESEDSSSILSHSPSMSSLNRLRDTFRRTESLSSQLSSIVSNAASAASGAVLGTSAIGGTSEASSASNSQVSTPIKKKKPVSNVSRKRKRENEVKKWTDGDIKKVLNYMQANRNVEKPTAKLYYKKLLQETQINATWNTLKCKVRHLKGTLQKANAWINSTVGGVEDDDGTTTVKDKIRKICPHYAQLSDIFSTAKEIDVVVMEISPDVIDYSPHNVTDSEDESIVLSDKPTTPLAANTFTDKIKRSTQNTCLEKLTSIETERIKFREKQLKLEMDKFEWTKEVEKKKIEMDRLKIEKEFELRKLELEQNERVKMYEIEMKYKNK